MAGPEMMTDSLTTRRPARAVKLATLPLAALALLLAGCGGSEAPPPPPPAKVAIITVEPSAISISDELPGRVAAWRVAEIRPQVSGVIQRRLFQEGSEVRAGQPLFQIDPAPFRADADSAAASVARAKSAVTRTRLQEERLQPLVKEDAISGQAYDDAVAARLQAEADLAQAQANARRRQVDLGFATIRSPIAGRIDQAVMTEGALASVGAAAPLATVQQIDRVYVDVRQPAARLEALREAARAGTADKGAEVEILSTDGRPYAMRGRLLFSGISVDPGTGEVLARVEVSNPGRQLLPGMFVRARLPRLSLPDALTVPAQAVGRDASGNATVRVVDAKGAVVARPVSVGEQQDGRLVITSGLERGEQVVVEGPDRLPPDTVVETVPWRHAAN